MAALHHLIVHYHFEINGKKIGPDFMDHVASAASDYNSLKTILVTNNSRGFQNGTFVVDDVIQASGPLQLLT